MAVYTNVFTEKETNNWFKACIALNVTKDGLTNFVELELRQVHVAVGRSCGNCCIENLLPCPTQGLCKKRKRNNCTFHRSLLHQHCQTCDQVRQNITSLHRFKGPSWLNTKAERWATDSWEIGKCYLPPDGYSSVSAVKESDLNGVISVMLNCRHFETCLSASLSPPPPDPQCLLEKVSQIGRAVRHTANCKITDADLQDYFHTLSMLLADPKCLRHDPSATIARTKLSDLQNDRMSLNELGELLKDANQTLKHAKEAGKLFSEEAERTLVEALKTIEKTIQAGELRIQCKSQEVENKIDIKTKESVQQLEDHTQERIERIQQAGTDKAKEDYERGLEGRDAVNSATLTGVGELTAETIRGKQDIESAVIDANEALGDVIQDGVREMHSAVHRGKAEIKTEVIAAKKELRDCEAEKEEEKYVLQCDEMLRGLMKHYNNTRIHVTLSPLNDCVQEKLCDIYMPPKVQLMVKNKGSFVKTVTQITKYKEVFLTDGKLNRQSFIQGEAGTGKSTFLAKLVLDWCSISTTTTEPLSTEETTIADSVSRKRCSTFFEDLTTLQDYKFVFYITLRDSITQHDVTEMIKEKIIDSIYSKEDREKAYKLLNAIMKKESCLILLDGLDEWKGPGGNHALPSLVTSHSHCVSLITTRPWKLAEGKIKHSEIDALLQLEGINDPFEMSRTILSCLIYEKELTDTFSEFESYIRKQKLDELLSSPMMLSVIVVSYAEGTELKGSKCEIYSLLLDSLLKKASSETAEFQQPPFPCFKETQYIQPNIEHVKRLAEAAFHLLFSDTRENSLVFSTNELKQYKLEERKDFALKAGIISATKKASSLRSSSTFSFIHKSVQEFLAAYHIAYNTDLIDDVIAGYLNHHNDAYLDISQVFIFLCGLNISAANTLSDLMNAFVADIPHFRTIPGVIILHDRSKNHEMFTDIILSGYREAAASTQSGIHLHLSYFEISTLNDDNINDVHSIWEKNKLNAKSFLVWEQTCIASRIEFDLSSCHKLKSLELHGRGIGLRDIASSSSSDCPVWFILHSADPAQCADPAPVLPSIEWIETSDVTYSSTFLRSLFNTMLTVGHKVMCELVCCDITSGVKGVASVSDEYTIATICSGLNNTFEISNIDGSPGLWDALHGLNIKSLSLSGQLGRLKVNHVSSFSQSLSSLPQLETLSIEGIDDDSPGLWEALHGLNIKSLSLSGRLDLFKVKNVSSLSQSLSLLPQLETLSIDVYGDSPDLWEALHGLSIKSLTLRMNDNRRDLKVKHFSSLSQSLSSLPQLETLSIKGIDDDSPGLWEALHGLNIKSLSLSGGWGGLAVNHVLSLSQSLSSLTQLETLTIVLYKYIDLQLPQSLNYLNLYYRALLPSQLLHLVKKLSACTQSVECSLDIGCACYTDNPHIYTTDNLSLEEYIPIKQELAALEHVEVKRFRIYDRTRDPEFDILEDNLAPAWSVRDVVVDDDNDVDDDDNDTVDDYVCCFASVHHEIITRISMRLQINCIKDTPSTS